MKGYNLLFGVFYFILLFPFCIARSNSYYDIVNAITDGKEFYSILKVTPESTKSEIKKSFRALSLQYHPDKSKDNRTPEGQQRYKDLTFAHEVLTDEEKKQEYDNLLKNGVSRAHRFYGRYAYAYGAPNVDAEYILAGLLVFISIFQYFYKYYRNYFITERAKETLRYKTMQAQALREGKPPPELVIKGAEPPKYTDVLIVQLVIFPWISGKAIWNMIKKKDKNQEEDEEEIRQQLGLSPEEYLIHKEKQQQKMEEMRTSTKAKQMRRFLKKYGKT